MEVITYRVVVGWDSMFSRDYYIHVHMRRVHSLPPPAPLAAPRPDVDAGWLIHTLLPCPSCRLCAARE